MMTTDVYPGKDLGTLELAITDEMVQHSIKGLDEQVVDAVSGPRMPRRVGRRPSPGGVTLNGFPDSKIVRT